MAKRKQHPEVERMRAKMKAGLIRGGRKAKEETPKSTNKQEGSNGSNRL